MVYVVQFCRQLASRIRMELQCPKYVEFHSKKKFEKLVHLVGFTIRICYDARSHERQTSHKLYLNVEYVVILEQEQNY
jgi:hypothetical protein